MKLIVVDDERLARENLVALLHRVEAASEVVSFSHAGEALAYLADNGADVAFFDIEMGGLSGIALAKECKALYPKVNIIFVTGYSQYMTEAFRLHVSGYLLKPVRERDLRSEMDNLRFPLSTVSARRVRVQAFGNFEVFVDGKPLHFPRSKSKECLAYLIDRKGAMISVGELAAVLYEDKPNDSTLQNNVYQVIFTLMKTLKDAGVQDIIIKSHRAMGIDTEKVNCDYYTAAGEYSAQANTFAGEYMTNYSWAEFTLGGLTVQKTDCRHQ